MKTLLFLFSSVMVCAVAQAQTKPIMPTQDKPDTIGIMVTNDTQIMHSYTHVRTDGWVADDKSEQSFYSENWDESGLSQNWSAGEGGSGSSYVTHDAVGGQLDFDWHYFWSDWPRYHSSSSWSWGFSPLDPVPYDYFNPDMTTYSDDNGGSSLNTPLGYEYCDVQNNPPDTFESGDLGGGDWGYAERVSHHEYFRYAQTRMMLLSGGRAIPGRQILHRIVGWAKDVIPPYGIEGQPPYRLIYNSQLTAFGLEQHLPNTSVHLLNNTLHDVPNDSSYGMLYCVKPAGAGPIDCTPTVDKDKFYAWQLGDSPCALNITANNIDLSTTTPTFCVGQKVFFTLNGLPDFVDAVGRWNLPGTFVNEQWQHYITDPATGLPTFYGSVNYRENSDLLNIAGRNVGTSCWYYDKLDNGKVSMHVNLHMSNDQYVSVAADGEFNVYKPSIAFQATPGPTVDVDISPDNGDLSLMVGHNDGTGAMRFGAHVESVIPGEIITSQLINCWWSAVLNEDIPISGGTGGGFWLDNEECYPGSHKSLDPNAGGTLYVGNTGLFDQPALQLKTVYCSASRNDSFKTYFCFRPSGGDSIYVTLGRANWNWFGNAIVTTDFPPMALWILVSGGTTGPTFTETQEFQVWDFIYSNLSL